MLAIPGLNAKANRQVRPGGAASVRLVAQGVVLLLQRIQERQALLLRLLFESVLGVLQSGRDILIDALQALLQLGILLFQCVIVLQGIADLIFELATFRDNGA